MSPHAAQAAPPQAWLDLVSNLSRWLGGASDDAAVYAARRWMALSGVYPAGAARR